MRTTGETVSCDVDFGEEENDKGYMQARTLVTCGECSHSEKSWGDGPRSVKRCLVLLRENCPRGENNFYEASGGEDK